MAVSILPFLSLPLPLFDRPSFPLQSQDASAGFTSSDFGSLFFCLSQGQAFEAAKASSVLHLTVQTR
jgi:hypothetical protein